MSWKSILVVLLVVVISVSPRIRIGTLRTGRNVDLRYEDFILVFIIALWFLRLSLQSRKILYLSPLAKPVLIYLYFALLSTLFGVVVGWLVPAMAFFFCLKEIQFFVLFLVVANFIEKYSQLKAVIATLFVCGIANGIYSIYQFVTGNFPTGVGYGAGSLGEPATFPTAGYFAMVFLMSISVLFVSASRNLRLLSAVSALFCGIGLISTASRANITGVAFSVSVLLILVTRESFRTANARYVYVVIFLLVILLIGNYMLDYFMQKRPSLRRITDIQHYRRSFFDVRVKLDYIPALQLFKRNPILGIGKTAFTIVLGAGEVHNYYLRVLLEMGIVGLFSFLYIVLSIMRMSVRLISKSQIAFARPIGFACILAILSLMIAAIGQDAFLSVKVNETFWTLLGLGAAAYRMSFEPEGKAGDLWSKATANSY